MTEGDAPAGASPSSCSGPPGNPDPTDWVCIHALKAVSRGVRGEMEDAEKRPSLPAVGRSRRARARRIADSTNAVFHPPLVRVLAEQQGPSGAIRNQPRHTPDRVCFRRSRSRAAGCADERLAPGSGPHATSTRLYPTGKTAGLTRRARRTRRNGGTFSVPSAPPVSNLILFRTGYYRRDRVILNAGFGGVAADRRRRTRHGREKGAPENRRPLPHSSFSRRISCLHPVGAASPAPRKEAREASARSACCTRPSPTKAAEPQRRALLCEPWCSSSCSLRPS
jgi:hypothetical protein